MYIKFSDFDGFELIMSASYYSKNKDREIIFSNYSEDGSRQYDKLQTHIIGESNEDVETIDEQIDFMENN